MLPADFCRAAFGVLDRLARLYKVFSVRLREGERLVMHAASLAVVCVAGCTATGPAPEQSRRTHDPVVRDAALPGQWREIDASLPPYPVEENLLAFLTEGTSTYLFFVDAESVRVDDDGVVRYSVVARSSSGVENVSFEGIHCEAQEYKIYAFGLPVREWSALQGPRWKTIEKKRNNDYRHSLYQHYFCPDGFPHIDAREAVMALRHGRPVFKGR
jgi:hypothetical protein